MNHNTRETKAVDKVPFKFSQMYHCDVDGLSAASVLQVLSFFGVDGEAVETI